MRFRIRRPDRDPALKLATTIFHDSMPDLDRAYNNGKGYIK
jgi:hypothetical protein